MNPLESDPCVNNHGGNYESNAAHRSIIKSKEILHDRIMRFVKAEGIAGAICDEIEMALGISHQTASARCTELLTLGRLQRTGDKRKTRSGRNASILQAVLLALLLFAAPLLAQAPPLNFYSGNCQGAAPGVNSLLWTGPTSYPLCLVIGPTLKVSTVAGRAQLDAVIPAPTNPGPGSGASMGTQLGDFAVRYTSPTVLTMGGNCSIATICNVRFGEATAQFASPAQITIAPSSNGIARVFIDGSLSPPVIGILTYNGGGTTNTIGVTCTGVPCNVGTGTGFPADSIPLASWSASNGTWDLQGGIDYRALYSTFRFVGGPGIRVVELFGVVTISIDPNQ